MQALTVVPGRAGSIRLEAVAEPAGSDGPVLVEALALGVCGTDTEIVNGSYGWSVPGKERLILGHESLGRVVEAPDQSGIIPGDFVVGIVRRPDPVPCTSCAAGEWDMCRNGRYTERGIKQLEGFGSERWRIAPEFAVRLDPALSSVGVLLEPASVVAKAWEHIDRIGARAHWAPRRVLVTGAGPIGLLAALLGTERALEVHVLDRLVDGPKPALVHDLGATYHVSSVAEACPDPDVILECTGAGQLVLDAIEHIGAAGIVCLTGVSSRARTFTIDTTALNREMVLENVVVFGSVNANRRHYETAAAALARADRRWLERLITRRVPLEQWSDAFVRRPDDVKPIIDFAA